LKKDIEEVLLTKQQLAQKTKELGAEISKDYEGKNLLLISLLKGGVVFTADLMREITIPLDIDFMAVSSYGDLSSSSGIIKIVKDLNEDVRDKNLLIVEDIIDSGLTLKFVKNLLEERGAKSVKICTILDKPDRRKVEVDIDYLGFKIKDVFVVGYGLDYANRYRNLPFVGILKESVYKM